MSTWTIDLTFSESHEEDTDHTHTQAMAILRTPDGRELRGLGQARRSPDDRPVPAIGAEVAGSRALSSLAHELLNYAAGEIEKNLIRDDPVV